MAGERGLMKRNILQLAIVVGLGLQVIESFMLIARAPWQNDSKHLFAAASILLIGIALPVALVRMKQSTRMTWDQLWHWISLPNMNTSLFMKSLLFWIFAALMIVIVLHMAPHR